MNLINTLKRHEGFRSKPYHCSADKLTIGYGRNLEDRGITEEEAAYLLNNDIELARQDCKKVFSEFNHFSQARRDALVNMMFNLGLSRFKGFKKMIAAINEGDWSEAKRQALDSRWRQQVKSRCRS